MLAKAAVLVPCFNEEENIPSVVATLKKHVPEMDIIIINDCSTDHTAAVAAAAGVKAVLEDDLEAKEADVELARPGLVEAAQDGGGA